MHLINYTLTSSLLLFLKSIFISITSFFYVLTILQHHNFILFLLIVKTDAVMLTDRRGYGIFGLIPSVSLNIPILFISKSIPLQLSYHQELSILYDYRI